MITGITPKIQNFGETYTLIAFKPEHVFWDRDSCECLPARLIREDGLTREQVLAKIDVLRKKQPEIEYGPNYGLGYSKENDREFEEFHVFSSIGLIDIEDLIVADKK